MDTIRLYAHEDSDDLEEAIEEDIEEHPSVTPSKIRAIYERKPLYEVGFEFDLDTGQCVSVTVEKQKFVPAG